MMTLFLNAFDRFYVWKDLVLGDQWQPGFGDEPELVQL